MEPTEITAGRLHLRPWRPDDADVVLAAGQDAQIQRWSTWPVPYLPEHARTYVGEAAAEGWRSGKHLGWAVCDSTTGDVLAGASLRPGREDGLWDVGYWCAPGHRGGGVTAEALGTVSRWSFAVLDARRLEWVAEVGNWPSRRVAEKAGFTVEGVRRGGLMTRGTPVEAWLGGRLPGDGGRDTAAFPSYDGVSDGVVALRRWRASDAADVARACSDDEIARWLPVPVPYTEAEGLGYVDGIVPSEWFAGTVANVAVVDAADRSLLGAVGLTLRSGLGEVGYWTAPWARGRGVAGRAALLHARWGIEALGLPRIELLADVDNPASQRVAEKAGFVREGVLRAVRPAPRDPERRVDMVLYALVPDPVR